jgi:hypothetical protein
MTIHREIHRKRRNPGPASGPCQTRVLYGSAAALPTCGGSLAVFSDSALSLRPFQSLQSPQPTQSLRSRRCWWRGILTGSGCVRIDRGDCWPCDGVGAVAVSRVRLEEKPGAFAPRSSSPGSSCCFLLLLAFLAFDLCLSFFVSCSLPGDLLAPSGFGFYKDFLRSRYDGSFLSAHRP